MVRPTPEDAGRMHDQRHRAEVFGTAADDYDRYRPSYPDTLIDDLVAGRPERALDIGCGTGKAGRLIGARGVDVLGVEIDEDMAEVARRGGMAVEVASFETWDAAGRTFDLAVSGQAWHWIDPALGVPKVSGLLRPGGLLALFWNAIRVEADVRDVLRATYERLAPGVSPLGRQLDEERDPPYAEDLRNSGLFASVELRKYPWQRTYSAREYARLVQTYSDHLVLPAEQRAALSDGVVAAVDSVGGQVVAEYETLTIVALAQR